MNEQPKSPDQDNEPNQPTADEADMANLALDLQKIEGYDPAVTEPAPTTPILPAQHPASSELPNASFGSTNKNKKKWIMSGVAAAIVLALGVGGWSAYAFWYQNPDKVISDALVNAATAKTASISGSYSQNLNDGASYNLSMTAAGGLKDGLTGSGSYSYNSKATGALKIDGSFVQTSGGDYYYKLGNLQNAYDTYLKTIDKKGKQDGYQDEEIKQGNTIFDKIFKPIIQKLDGNWFSFKAGDLQDYDKELSDQYTCQNKVITDFMNDKAQQTELWTIYQKYKIITVTQSLGLKDGNLGFVVKVDDNAVKDFVKDYKNTKFYKAGHACEKNTDTSIDTSKDDAPTGGVTRFEIWVSQWTHQLSKIHLEVYLDQQTGSADMQFQYNQPVNAVAPKDAKSTKELIDQFKTTMTELFGISNSGTQSSQGAEDFGLDSSQA